MLNQTKTSANRMPAPINRWFNATRFRTADNLSTLIFSFSIFRMSFRNCFTFSLDIVVPCTALSHVQFETVPHATFSALLYLSLSLDGIALIELRVRRCVKLFNQLNSICECGTNACGREISDTIHSLDSHVNFLYFSLCRRCVDIGKYSMIGSNVRTCIHSEWSGHKPACSGLNQENDYASECEL